MNRQSLDEFNGRKAPYAPITSLEQFLEKIRDRTAPERVDHRYLAKMNVASNNEYALLSALKFLGLLDSHGIPTHAFRVLQTTDSADFRDTLRHLVQTAYAPVFDAGAETWCLEDQINFFRHASSPSQAKNATRFFRAVCALCGLLPDRTRTPGALGDPLSEDESTSGDRATQPTADGLGGQAHVLVDTAELVLYKARLLEKLPPMRAEWSAREYAEICDRFLSLLREV